MIYLLYTVVNVLACLNSLLKYLNVIDCHQFVKRPLWFLEDLPHFEDLLTASGSTTIHHYQYMQICKHHKCQENSSGAVLTLLKMGLYMLLICATLQLLPSANFRTRQHGHRLNIEGRLKDVWKV